MVERPIPKHLLTEKKKELTYYEVVTAPKFQKVLTDTSNAILRSHNRTQKTKISMIYDPTSGITAYTDNYSVVINAGNPMFCLDENGKEVSVQEAASRVAGVDFHEHGHILYTCFSEMQRMGQLFENGQLIVVNVAEDQIDAYNELSEFMKNEKACVMTQCPVPVKDFIFQVYMSLMNCIEDSRIERLLLENDGQRFEAMAAGLTKLREHHKKEGKTWDLSEQTIPVFTDLCLLYAKYGMAGTYTGGFEAFEKAKPIINEMLETHKARKFAELNFKLLLCIWPAIKAKIEEIENKQNGSEDGQSAENTQSGEGNGEKQSGEGQSGGEGNAEEGKQSDKNQSSGSSSGNPSKQENSSQKEPSNSASEQEMQNALNEILNKIKEHMPEEKSSQKDSSRSAEKEQQASQSKTPSQRDPNGTTLEATIDNIMKDLADDKVRESAANEACKTLRAAASKGFSEYYGTDVINPSPSFNSQKVIEDVESHIKRSVKKASREIQRHLETDMRTGTSKNKMYGSKFHAEKLVKGDFRYFSNKTQKKDMPKVRVGLLIDESGSMGRNDRCLAARTAAITLYDLFEQIPNLDIAIYGHTASGGRVEIFDYTDFGIKSNKVREKLCNISARGGNIDIVPFTALAKNLLKQDAEKRIMFVITDGLPHSYSREGAESELRKAANDFTRKGVDIIVASIGSDEKALKGIYTNQRFLNISDPAQLPKKVADVIKRNL